MSAQRHPVPEHLAPLTAQALNDYADAIVNGRLLPGMAPTTPGFWFSGLAREQAQLWRCPKTARLLSADTRELLLAEGFEVAAVDELAA